MPFPYPVFLDLTGVPVLVVGGGAIALRKATGLTITEDHAASNTELM